MKKFTIFGILLIIGFIYFLIRDYNSVYLDISTEQPKIIDTTVELSQKTEVQKKETEFDKFKNAYFAINGKNYETSVISSSKPNISIVLIQKDVSDKNIRNVINSVENFVTIALNPQKLKADTINLARQKRHEVLISIPMEPINFPDNNPGTLTLLTGLTFDENSKNLEKIFAITDKNIGFINVDGGRFVVSKNDLLPVLEKISTKKLFFINAVSYDNSTTDSILQESDVTAENFTTLLPYDYLSEERLKELFNTIDSIANNDPKKLQLVVLYASGLSIKNLNNWTNKNKQNYNFITLSNYFLEKKRLYYENTKSEKNDNVKPSLDSRNA